MTFDSGGMYRNDEPSLALVTFAASNFAWRIDLIMQNSRFGKQKICAIDRRGCGTQIAGTVRRG